MEKKYLIRGVLSVLLLLFLIAIYPYLLDLFMGAYIERMTFCIDPTTRGTFGDMYGVLNAFLSGLAILGIVFTLYWEKAQEEKKQIEDDVNRLTYLVAVIQEINSILADYKSGLDGFYSALSNVPFVIPVLRVSSVHKRIKQVTKKLDQERYYLAYRRMQDLESNSIMKFFSGTPTLYVQLSHTIEFIEDKTNADYPRKLEFRNCLNQLEYLLRNFPQPNIVQKQRESIGNLLNRFDNINDKSDLLQIFECLVPRMEEFINSELDNRDQSSLEYDYRPIIDSLKRDKSNIENQNKEILTSVAKLSKSITAYLNENNNLINQLNRYLTKN
jgi:hypothetical protein